MDIIHDQQHMKKLLQDNKARHYVYILRHPDEIECFGGIGTPFYVGIGQGLRMFQHALEARNKEFLNAKVLAIRQIWSAGKEIAYTIDSWHETTPYLREAELLNKIGLLSNSTGPLTNAQNYAPPNQIDGIEVSKYLMRQKTAGDVNGIPADFPYRKKKLQAGSRKPRRETSVFGIIYKKLEENPGITGEDLVKLLLDADWSVCNSTKYTATGRPCATWVCDYIKGGFYKKNQHIEVMSP